MGSNIELKFRENGHFRILMVSDIQEKPDIDPRTPVAYRKLIEKTDPDLIIWGGDNADGRYLKTEPELRHLLDVMTAPMAEKNIPWMHVYGNHDYDVDITPRRQNRIYASYPNCISGTSPRNLPGASDYVITVKGPDGSDAYAVYAFDSMYKLPELRPGVSCEDVMLNCGTPCKKWDVIRFETQMWYWKKSTELEKKNGHKVRALAVMHVPPYEFQRAIDNPEQTGIKEDYDQKLQSGLINCGIYATMLERGDVEIIAAGHLHKDTFDATYAGIYCCLDGCGGYAPSGLDDRRGGRIFDIDINGGFESRMVRYDKL